MELTNQSFDQLEKDKHPAQPPLLWERTAGNPSLSGVERLFGALNIPCRRQKGKHLFGKFLDSERSFGEHVFMTTNARSKTSPVSTPASPSSTMSFSPRPGGSAPFAPRQRIDWWERPPATAGSVHLSLSADRSRYAKSSARSGAAVIPASVLALSQASRRSFGAEATMNAAPTWNAAPIRTGAPARRESSVRKDTPRARFVALIGITMAVLLGGFGIANASSSPKSELRSYIVRPGDSFWSIARSVQSKGDLRPLVAELIEAHGSGFLQVGDRVELPAA
jgi:hypothetical protein